MPLRVRRLTGAEAERYRPPSGEAVVAVVELAITAPLHEVQGREDRLASHLRALEQGGPGAAAAFLRSWRR
jgi:hypothetical protein